MGRNGIYRNGDGYYDPTAGAAMSRIMKEYRQARKAEPAFEREVVRNGDMREEGCVHVCEKPSHIV